MPSDLHSLTAWAEAADPSEQREVLIAAWVAINGPDLAGGWATPDGGCGTNARWKFDRMIDAEAYESAAMMLLPARHNREHRVPVASRPEVYLWEPGTVPPFTGRAATEALALVAACLKARATQGENDAQH
jgi:hypothetical protein